MSNTPESVLIDASNIDQWYDQIEADIANALIIGIDLETQDVGAHEGIKALRKENEEGDKTAKGKSVFDWRRMVITGLSIWANNSPYAYYFNLNHADVENRLPWDKIKTLLECKQEEASWVAHNAPFEITVLKNTYDFELKNVICTLQMAVSAYGPDEYDRDRYIPAGLGGITEHFVEAAKLFAKNAPVEQTDEEEVDEEEIKSNRLTPKQNELLNKVIGKTSRAAGSYNGLTIQLAYSYGLKEMVKKFFDYQMTTFTEVLGDRRHMGELTGAEVVAYGCDDSYWAVRLLFELSSYMAIHCPEAVDTFFTQENPMIYVYSQVRCEGMKVNLASIEKVRDSERIRFAQVIRELKAVCRSMLPFREEPDERMMFDGWYSKLDKTGKPGYQKNREKFAAWANSKDEEDDFKQACQVSSAVSNAWAGVDKNPGISIGHYMQARLMMYDLCQLKAVIYKGKVQSDAETRGELRERVSGFKATETNPILIEHWAKVDRLLALMGEIAGIEQRMKLYLTPYTCLTDPETQRMYPEISSMLASRRMAASNPNPMQLAKRGESVFVRGFYEPDEPDEVYVSLDWSQVELVLVGELSGDPEFAKAFGQLPYNDLHLGAAADVLSIMIPEVTYDLLKNMATMKEEDLPPKLLIKPNGDKLTPQGAKKFWRTEIGKGSNFNYWYSGALATVGEKLGWTSKQMWEATEKYRERFAVAEEWRTATILQGRECGMVMLPDGHRRVRWEATYEWANITQRLFDQYRDAGISAFGREIIRSIKSRAGNQLVNSLIQGTSATLAKRSIIAIKAACKEQGIRATFKMPIHDELLFSVHRDDVVKFIKLAKSIMMNHPDIVKNLKLYATASVGLTFEPFDDVKAPFGQVELDEAPAILGFGKDAVLDDEQIAYTVNWLFERRNAA